MTNAALLLTVQINWAHAIAYGVTGLIGVTCGMLLGACLVWMVVIKSVRQTLTHVQDLLSDTMEFISDKTKEEYGVVTEEELQDKWHKRFDDNKVEENRNFSDTVIHETVQTPAPGLDALADDWPPFADSEDEE